MAEKLKITENFVSEGDVISLDTSFTGTVEQAKKFAVKNRKNSKSTLFVSTIEAISLCGKSGDSNWENHGFVKNSIAQMP